MKVLSWNCSHGLRNKLDVVKLIIMKHQPDIFFINEAELNPERVDRVKIDGFNLEVAKSIKDGLARTVAYVRRGLNVLRCQHLEDESLDVVILESRSSRLVGVYRGFRKSKHENPLTKLFECLREACVTTKEIVIIGDLNIDPTRDVNTPQGRSLEALIVDFSLHQLVNEATRNKAILINGEAVLQSSKLDLVLSTVETLMVKVGSQYNSDHAVIHTHGIASEKVFKTEKFTIRDWTSLTTANVINEWLNRSSRLESLDSVSEKIVQIVDTLAPFRVIRTRLPEQVINPRVEKVKKRRDRALKKLRKEIDPRRKLKFTNKLKILDKSLSMVARHIAKATFQKKAGTANTKSFWKMVNKFQGKTDERELMIEINGNVTSDAGLISEEFGKFFKGKIELLTSSQPPINWNLAPRSEIHPFSHQEIKSALEQCKSKMSSGVDGVPMRVLKMIGLFDVDLIRTLLNEVLKDGFPSMWKLAKVVPIFKKGDRKRVENYRPVSNLCSLSKVFEKCILNRIQQLPNFNAMVGEHQHGFRKHCSTVTCALSLKDRIVERVEEKSKLLVYSLDLTAAFDMLRPDLFFDMLADDIPSHLMDVLMDFLRHRRFFVDICGSKSSLFSIDRGCPQGSVLGPILFSLYVCKSMMKLPPDVDYFSYADDSYVIVRGDTVTSCKERLETVVKDHINELKSIGMIVNGSKTEIIQMCPKPDDEVVTSVQVDNTDVSTVTSMKVLGLTFDKRLDWSTHIDNLKGKMSSINNGIKLIRRKLTRKQAITVVTAQALSILYYASIVWLTPHISKKQEGRVESLHYRSMRLVIKDYRQRIGREIVDSSTSRLPPKLWCHYTACSFFMNLRRTGQPRSLLENMSANLYEKGRQPNRLFGYDSSSSRLGRIMTKNWIGQSLDKISEPWTHISMSKDMIRTCVKKCIYPPTFARS